MLLHEAMPSMRSVPFLGPITTAVGLVGAAASVLTKVPAGKVALRLHSGQAERQRDSFVVPEWKAGTLYGRYDTGWHIIPPGIHNLEYLSLMDRPDNIATQITTPGKKSKKKRTYDVAAMISWGIPREFDPQSRWQDADVCYETLLLRALFCAGEKINDVPKQAELVRGICTANLRTVMMNYKDPTGAKSEDVHLAMVELSTKPLIQHGFELRGTVLDRAVLSEAQIEANAKVEAAKKIGDAIGLLGAIGINNDFLGAYTPPVSPGRVVNFPEHQSGAANA